jgi:hypothetical protein
MLRDFRILFSEAGIKALKRSIGEFCFITKSFAISIKCSNSMNENYSPGMSQ